jgi:hypothetical protein
VPARRGRGCLRRSHGAALVCDGVLPHADQRAAVRVSISVHCIDATRLYGLYPSLRRRRFKAETTPASPESPHASHGPRDEEPRHRPSTDAAAGGDLRVAGYGPGTH